MQRAMERRRAPPPSSAPRHPPRSRARPPARRREREKEIDRRRAQPRAGPPPPFAPRARPPPSESSSGRRDRYIPLHTPPIFGAARRHAQRTGHRVRVRVRGMQRYVTLCNGRHAHGIRRAVDKHPLLPALYETSRDNVSRGMSLLEVTTAVSRIDRSIDRSISACVLTTRE